jgi:hypothetical protein
VLLCAGDEDAEVQLGQRDGADRDVGVAEVGLWSEQNTDVEKGSHLVNGSVTVLSTTSRSATQSASAGPARIAPISGACRHWWRRVRPSCASLLAEFAGPASRRLL